MTSLLPPDPYKALGLPRDADIALIKKTYKKMALSCHPDKVTDESLKQQKQEEFHKINQAYELLSNEASRRRYDDEYTLEQLHKEKLSRGGAKMADPASRPAARYDVRTQAPAGATFSAPTAHRYEEHKPSRPYEDRYYDDRSRKADPYDSYVKPSSSSRSSRDKEIPIKITRVYTDRTRSDHKKARDKEERRERERRFVSVEDDSDEKTRYEAEYRRRSEEARRRKDEEELLRAAADARRKAEEQRRSYDDKVDRTRKLNDMETNAVRYIHRTKVEAAAERPSPGRSSSSRGPEYYETRSRRDRERPEAPRRSSARPKEHTSSSGRDRDRKGIEIVDWESGEIKVPSFKQSSSSPAELHVPRSSQRAYTESSRDHRYKEPSPTPKFRRSETMPSVSHSSSRRAEATAPRPSGLRESNHDSGASSPEFPTIPPPSSSKTKYFYQTSSGGVRLTEDAGVANGHRTVLHEPGRHRTRSPSPLSRPPMGANRPVDPSTNYSTAIPKVTPIPPPLSRNPTVQVEPERGRQLYGEIPADKLRRENARRQTNFSPDQVSYTQKIGPEDISWSAPRGQSSRMDEDRHYAAKPGITRHATSVY